MTDEVQAACEALKYARGVAEEQPGLAYVYVDKRHDYFVTEAMQTGCDRRVCTVNSRGEIDWKLF